MYHKRKTRIYQLKITLEYTDPPVWRRVLFKGNDTFRDLHLLIQKVMEGWDDTHLHVFIINEKTYGDPHYRDSTERRRFDSLITEEETQFEYIYDLGDRWEHTIQVEKITEPEPDKQYPLFIAGEYPCPLEDCGALFGYLDMVEAFEDPKNPDHDDAVMMLGEDFDPEKFDLKKIPKQLIN